MANSQNSAKESARQIGLPSWVPRLAAVITFLIMIALTYLMITPINQLPIPKNRPDFLFHVVLYFFLVAPCATTYPAIKVHLGITAFLIGAFIELIQPFFGRGFELMDLLANATGIVLAIWASRSLRQILVQLVRRVGPTPA